MLELRKYKEDEIEDIKKLLISEKINDLELSGDVYIVSENYNLIGVCKVEIDNENSWLNYLLIKEENRGENLGDGLLRTVLNKLDLQGIRKIYYNKMDLYLTKKGFIKNEEGILELSIADFFTAGCKCSGGSNEI